MKVIIGADGGGTKTKLVCCDMEGNTISSASGDGMNYNFIGVKAAAKNFKSTVAMLSLPEDAELVSLTIGDPATDDTNDNPMTDEFISALKSSGVINENTAVFIKSDVYMALYGLTQGEPGALIVSGTGAMGAAIDRTGKTFMAGGWGRLTGDEGSGYYIALSGIKAALRYNDGAGRSTTLLDEFIDFYSLSSAREFIPKYYASPDDFPIAPFAKKVALCADDGDGVALEILGRAADFLSGYAIALLIKINETSCPMGIYGSVLTSNTMVRERFIRRIASAYPNVVILQPPILPEKAAVLYSIQMLSI